LFDSCAVEDVFKVDIKQSTNDEWKARISVNGNDLLVEIDSSARCNVLSKKTAESFMNISTLKPSYILINGVSGTAVKALGQMTLPCTYKSITRDITFRVMNTSKSVNILGRDDCSKFNMITSVHRLDLDTEKIVSEYSDVVGKEIGCLPGEYDIKIRPDVLPVVHAPRSVPVTICDQLKTELDHLQKCGFIAQVEEPTDWVNILVCVRKKNGRVRIFIDPGDLNKAICREHYPMSSIDDIVTRIHDSKVFSTVDANMGYFQIKLSEQSSMLTTFNTPFGRYRYLRLPMGIKCAGEVYQREMMHHFGAIPGVEVVVDELLIHGATIEEHNERLRAVLKKARSINLKFNKEKCTFAQPEVDYVGYRLTGEGLKPSNKRVQAILNLRNPENQAELETVLGMLAYVGQFILNLSEVSAPLREFKKADQWKWTDEASTAFVKIKDILVLTDVLEYFNVKKSVILTVDASAKGLGAAVIQEDGVVAYASRTLTAAELLVLVFGCTRFHKLIYGKSDVVIQTAHKPPKNYHAEVNVQGTNATAEDDVKVTAI